LPVLDQQLDAGADEDEPRVTVRRKMSVETAQKMSVVRERWRRADGERALETTSAIRMISRPMPDP